MYVVNPRSSCETGFVVYCPRNLHPNRMPLQPSSSSSSWVKSTLVSIRSHRLARGQPSWWGATWFYAAWRNHLSAAVSEMVTIFRRASIRSRASSFELSRLFFVFLRLWQVGFQIEFLTLNWHKRYSRAVRMARGRWFSPQRRRCLWFRHSCSVSFGTACSRLFRGEPIWGTVSRFVIGTVKGIGNFSDMVEVVAIGSILHLLQ